MSTTPSTSLSRRGFTLVEVLLTLLIMSGILLSLTQILHAARRTRDTIHNLQESELAGPAILDRIERDLRGILTYDRTRAAHFRLTNRVVHGYDGDSIDFVTTTDSLQLHLEGDTFRRADFNEVGYRVRLNPENDDFLEMYRREDVGIDEEPFFGGEFSFLHDRVKSFDVLAYAEDGPDAEPLEEWGQDNDENVGLPARIEISLTIELAGRIAREQLAMFQTTRRTRTYRRIIRFPENLRVKEPDLLVPRVPTGPSASPAGSGEGGTSASPGGGGAESGTGSGEVFEAGGGL